jgi:fibronectin type 3 domain-containing protein
LLAVLLITVETGCAGGPNGGSSSVTVPATPTGLAATAGNAQVTLSWSASTGTTSYNLKRAAAASGPYATINSPTTTSYTDTGLTNGAPYYYEVSAVNSAGESANSSYVSATPTAPQIPATPTGLTATAGNAQVALTWNASTGTTSYNLKRAVAASGPYATINSPTTTSYTDTGLTNGTPYYYEVSAVNSAGESANSSYVSATPTAPVQIPPVPTGLAATEGNAQVSLTWNASTGATSYNLKRAVAASGPYATINSPTTTSYTDTGLTNGTPYYYEVSAVNSAGESANSSYVSATPTAGSSNAIAVTIDTMANRHAISPYVYGGAYPRNANTIADGGLAVVRWGGNATSTYNWQLGTNNADDDYYFEDFASSGFNNGTDGDSTTFISDVKADGSNPLMTMVMLPWVAQSAENGSNGHWSFSVAKYGAQCSTDYWNPDAGDGLKTDCSTRLAANPNDAYFPLLDQPGNNDPAGSVYRNQWAAALATAFGSAPHFYDMDNEIDIWGSTHFDIHPNPSSYQELRDTYLTEARNLKSWDAAAIRLGPVSCCWWFYWNSQVGGSDKTSHGGVDFLPWWLNDVYWSDSAAGTRSVDIFDIHAYPEGPDMSSYTLAQKQAAAIRVYREWWDPTYVSESGDINQPWTTQTQPLQTIAFRIPRMRALANTIYPGTPLSITEWSAEFVSAADFSTALGDAEAYGILGRENVYLASRWTAPEPGDSSQNPPVPRNPNYEALKLYTNYDGAHHMFGTTSVSATHNANTNLFSVFAALSSAGTTLTVMVVNGDPANAAQVSFTLNHFNAANVTSYALSQASPTSIVASSSQTWSATQTFPAYSATLLVINGTPTTTAAEWDLNPDAIRAPAGGMVTLAPKIVSTSGTVTLSSAVFDTYYTGAAAQSGNGGCSAAITASQVTTTQNGAITLTAGTTSTAPGFYHFTVTGSDGSGVTQTQGGWLLVGSAPATLTKTTDPGSGTRGTNITLVVTLAPGTSGGTATGASIFFTTDAGTLSQRIVTTNGSGVASVTLTLPGSSGTVHVTAEGPYDLGHPVVTFTEASN